MKPPLPKHWATAIEFAERTQHVPSPNPRVGCVLISASNALIGEGATEAAGSAHAEVVALRNARALGHDTQGATAYVTLEPCSHHGRTPPCCDALIAAGVAKVVVATLDPNPLVAGSGVERLRSAGIDVEVLPVSHPVAIAAKELNIGFFSRMVRKRPWVRMKLACSLDGKTALPDGESQWITSPEARADGHAWRARACRVLTGVGTVLADDPMLDVRDFVTPRQPHLVVVDSQRRTPASARLFGPSAQGSPRQVTLVGSASGAAARNGMGSTPPAEEQAQQNQLISHLDLPSPDGKVDLHALMAWLGGEGETNELHVEAGPTLSGALLCAGLVDELLVYQAPVVLGPGLPLLSLPALDKLANARRMQFSDVTQIGPDLRLQVRFAGNDAFLST
ncbi:bifunctional diaminohydroxyphosphoribosylaminopyrimidine deaminase/5-amino-6-(5-phosphoribosylamino)uracil reductase RibD [Hydrogenophaga sp. 5NK40-0174]|uniref:bifunctional diaminohydroxyphosphoribosylaminopyrimidine deaminase/5-amino-6-(5-phosphoribosylamino)uracil reductase RibD n=1 Tax=Hydrogenophaga sp. 5NK40-0174 TaxID=3127649 RepID=UPI0033422C4D